MKVLIIGSGGREHAIASSLSKSVSVTSVVCANGNPGISEVANLWNVDETDPQAVLTLAREVRPDLVVIGPEAPLVAGISDVLRDSGFDVFGPSQEAALIEGSKAFAKDVMASANVPNAHYAACSNLEEAFSALNNFDQQVVIKADGLAQGKGVILCSNHEEARAAIRSMMEDEAFGAAGSTVVIEEMMSGEEASQFFFCDGKTAYPLPSARDYKRALDNDEGLNTGGMGAYSPASQVDWETSLELKNTIAQPVLDELNNRGTPFIGLLYAGLMFTEDGVKVVEFNCRFGDPETQAILPRLKSDLGLILQACAKGNLNDIGSIEIDPRPAVSVVLSSGGYPSSYDTGFVIEGLDKVDDNVQVFHAGTAVEGGKLVTNGGRVLAVSALGESIAEARARAYDATEVISFAGAHKRTDIAADV